MMFLKSRSLTALAEFGQSEPQNAERHQEAEQDYLKGLSLIQKAQDHGYQDKSALLSAYRHLAAAQQKNRREPRYQTGMAYLMLLVGNTTRANLLLAEALRLAPGDERALMLLERLKQMQSAPPEQLRLLTWQALEGLPEPRQDEEYDQVYEELSAFINTEVRLMMQVMVSPEPTLELDLAQDQAMFLEQLNAFEALVSVKLEQLDAEIDTHGLYRQLEPLGLLSHRLEQALELHILFHVLLDGIDGALEESRSYRDSLAQNQTMSQEDLDNLLDLCDELADQIDDLSAHRAVKPLEARYAELVAEVGKLQDQLEGH